MITPVTTNSKDLLASAKWAFATRRVARADAVQLIRPVAQAVSGDLVLARVAQIGSHQRVQLTEGRPSTLYPGDLIVAACGARYAADQFEGIARIDPKGTDLLAGGGCLGIMRTRNSKMRQPTRVVPLGLLADAEGNVINLDRYALPAKRTRTDACVIGVIGASMNAGKTTAAAAFIRGLRAGGFRVGAIKATGTGAFGDFNAYLDAGANWVGDFTCAGMVSTYLQPIERIEQALATLIATGTEAGCEVLVVELADGVLQAETAALLRRADVRGQFSGFLYAVPDALAALGGQTALRQFRIQPLALTGLITTSPLNVEEAKAATGLPVLSKEELTDPLLAAALTRSATSAEAEQLAA
ncbi:MAG: hypothetical protein K9M02_18130 [Thiohalocapsa sp.]|nr:hypothetical protein [Thiohalocapsa sp.]